jgi:uncharacterized protein (TIGR03083 family)
MDGPGYGPCDVDYYIGCLRREGESLAAAAQRAGLDAAVPACPGWQVRDLLKHLGYVHRWATDYVRDQQPSWVDRASEAEILGDGPADADLDGWFRAGHAALVRTLAAASPGMTCWTFLEAPSPLAFWARRQAHETAVHRVDAEQAAANAAGEEGLAGEGPARDGHAASAAGLAPRFAADGVDELIMGFVGRSAKRGTWAGPPGCLAIHADDGADGTAHWRVDAAPGSLTISRGAGPADCDVTGPVADLYLLLWNRRGTSGLDVRGDANLLAGFAEQSRVMWA